MVTFGRGSDDDSQTADPGDPPSGGSSGGSSRGSSGGSSGGSSSSSPAHDRRRIRESVTVDDTATAGGGTFGTGAGTGRFESGDDDSSGSSSPADDRRRVRESVTVDDAATAGGGTFGTGAGTGRFEFDARAETDVATDRRRLRESVQTDVDAVDTEEVGRLDAAADTFRSTVSEPVGELVADATPATAVEERTLGTTRSRDFFEAAGTAVADIANVPAHVSAVGSGLEARSETQQAAGVGPAVATTGIPDPEGQQEQAERAGEAAARAAGAAAENPFAAAGTVTGAIAGGLGAAGAASRVRGATSGTSPTRTGLSDRVDVDDFLTDTRAQAQTGRQRRRSGDDDTVEIGADEIEPRQVDPDQGPAAFPDPQARFEGGAGFRRGSPDRGDVTAPTDVDPAGSGGGLGFRSVSDEAATATTPPRADSPLGPDLRSVGGAEAAGSGSAAGGAFGVGIGSQLVDADGELRAFDGPTGGAGGLTAADVESGAASGGAGPAVGDLDAINDPTGIGDTETEPDTGGSPVPLGGGGGGVGTELIGAETAFRPTDVGATIDASAGGREVGATAVSDADAVAGVGDRPAGARAAADVLTGAATRTAADAAPISDTVPQTATATGIATGSPTSGGRPTSARPPTTIRPPAFEAGLEEDESDEAPVFGIEADDEVFGTGILSGAEALDEATGGGFGLESAPDDPWQFGR